MERVSINLLEIGDKALSKSELYKILMVEDALYLNPYKFWSVDFMADIIEGRRVVNSSLFFYDNQWRIGTEIEGCLDTQHISL